jgi:hypothetical protein
MVSVLVLAFTMVAGVAWMAPGNWLPSVDAQNTSPSGSYGFVMGVSQMDSAGSNGGAVLGIMNFDGAGNVSGTAIVESRNTNAQKAQAAPLPFTGTYTSNPDGPGSINMNFAVGFSLQLTMVVTDGGQRLQLTGAICSPCGADVPLQLQGSTFTGAMPMGLFFNRALGNIPLSLSNVTAPSAGPSSLVYASAPATGSGSAQCADGAGNWTASIRTVTVAVNNGVGNFLASADGIICGQVDFETLSGLVYSNPGPGSLSNFVLHVVSGGVVNGIARASNGGSLGSSYGVQFSYTPFAAGTVGVMKFDSEGNVSVSFIDVGGTLSSPANSTLTGTYSTNPDGSGTINLTSESGQAGPTFAFVITDGGSQLLLLRTDSDPGFNASFGTARLQ